MAKAKKVEKKTFSLEAKGFYSDMWDDDALYAALIRSSSKTGIISKIEITDIPDGYFIFMAKDIPGKNKININGTDVFIFNDNSISYAGEAIGILCGPDKHKVYELVKTAEASLVIDSLDSTSINEEPKRPLIDVSETQYTSPPPSDNASPDTKQQAETYERKIVASKEVRTGLYLDKEIADAEKEIFDSKTSEFRGTWNLRQVESLWQETSGAFCKMTNGILHVYTAAKWSYLLLNILKQSIGLKDEQIFIHKTKTSGMYSNGIYKNAIIAAQTGIASYLTGKPVKLVFAQWEQEKYMKPGVNTTISYKTGVSPDGRLKSMNISIEIDIGIMNPFAQEILDRIAIASVGIYKPRNLYISAKAVSSPNPPTSVYPNIIDSQSFFAIESHIQQITSGMHILPNEFRIDNTPQNNLDFHINLKIPNIKEHLQTVMGKSDFNRKFASFRINAENRMKNDTFFALPLRGIGVACGYDGSGYYGDSVFSCNQKIEVTLNTDDILEIHTIKPSNAVENIWKKTVNDILQISPEKIKINAEFPQNEIPNIPEETSSNISVMTYLLKRCCLDIQKKRFHEPLPIKSKRQISKAMKNKWNSRTFVGTPFHSTSFGAAVIEIELDSYTYMEKIKGIWMCVDCGEIFDEKAAERALKLAIQQELACLVENERVTCDNYNITFIKSKESPGQIGKLVHNVIPAAFASALSLALSTEISTLPVSQSLLYELTKKKETEQAQIFVQENKEEDSNENSDEN